MWYSNNRLIPRGSLSALLVALIAFAGCNNTAPDPGTSGASVGTTGHEEPLSLKDTLAAVGPGELDVSVSRDLPTMDMNEWAKSMMTDMLVEVDEDKYRAALSAVVSDEITDRILNRDFRLRDTMHLRDAQWARSTVQSVVASDRNEVQRVTDLFHHVMQTVQLVDHRTESVPYGPFETMLSGRGTAEQRAWCVASLVRQLRISTVILSLPDNSAANKSAANNAAAGPVESPVLLGALVQGEIYLFDATRGLPVPGPTDVAADALIENPLTLRQAVSDDTLLRKFDRDAEHAWPVTAEDLKSASVLVTGDSTLWSRRMEAVQNAAAGDAQAIVFEPLLGYGAFEDEEAALNFVGAAVKAAIPEAQLGTWDVPEQLREARESLTTEQTSSHERFGLLLSCPQPVKINKLTDADADGRTFSLSFGSGRKLLRNARTNQVLCQYSSAIPNYVRVQQSMDELLFDDESDRTSAPPMSELLAATPSDIRERSKEAAETAQFWRATCQLQKKLQQSRRQSAEDPEQLKNDFESASDDLLKYLRQYPAGRFKNTAIYLASLSMVYQGRHSRAVGYLNEIPAHASEYPAAQYLVRRWSEARKQN